MGERLDKIIRSVPSGVVDKTARGVSFAGLLAGYGLAGCMIIEMARGMAEAEPNIAKTCLEGLGSVVMFSQYLASDWADRLSREYDSAHSSKIYRHQLNQKAYK